MPRRGRAPAADRAWGWGTGELGRPRWPSRCILGGRASRRADRPTPSVPVFRLGHSTRRVSRVAGAAVRARRAESADLSSRSIQWAKLASSSGRHTCRIERGRQAGSHSDEERARGRGRTGREGLGGRPSRRSCLAGPGRSVRQAGGGALERQQCGRSAVRPYSSLSLCLLSLTHAHSSPPSLALPSPSLPPSLIHTLHFSLSESPLFLRFYPILLLICPYSFLAQRRRSP